MLNFDVGGFVPRGIGSRDANDVILRESTNGGCTTGTPCPLATLDQTSGIAMNNFNSIAIGAEYLVGIGDKLEGGLGIGFYSRSVPTLYAFQTFQDGSDINNELKLRIVPFTATVRFLPLGHHSGVVPYIGGGVGVYAWSYTERGYFIDPTDRTIIDATSDPYTASGSATGPVVLGGVRIPAGDWMVGGEIRYQGGLGDLPTTGHNAFIAPKIDLGGMNYLFTLGFKF